MLERVGPKASVGDGMTPFMHFNKIKRMESGTGLCYVRNAVSKRTRADNPFITFYVSDVDGLTIPAYMFNIGEIERYGTDLFSCIGHIVKVDWEENYIDKVGMTLKLSKLSRAENVKADELALFVGQTEEVDGMFRCIMNTLKQVTGVRFNMPFDMKMQCNVDYDGGKVGGLIKTYYRTMKMMDGLYTSQSASENGKLGGVMSDRELKNLYGTFALFIAAHSHYIKCRDKGADDVSMLMELTRIIGNVSTSLSITAGAMELAYVFVGVEPKDFYVRTIKSVFDLVVRTDKEHTVLETLPELCEGNAGYGVIRKYPC